MIKTTVKSSLSLQTHLDSDESDYSSKNLRPLSPEKLLVTGFRMFVQRHIMTSIERIYKNLFLHGLCLSTIHLNQKDF